jgi:uncharacterized protein (DUF58 family)
MLSPSIQQEILQRLGRIGVTARHAVESLFSGEHRSVHRGLSVEFAGHRPYQPGDDVRHLDWQVYARSDSYDIRVFEEETRLHATLLVDYSGSMGYASQAQGGKKHLMPKIDYARNLAAVLAFLMVRQGDSVGVVIGDEGIRQHVPPASTMGTLHKILHALEDEAVGGDTSLAETIQQTIPHLRRRSMVMVISDCFDHAKPFTQAFQQLRFAGHDVRLLQIVDPEEEYFGLRGNLELRGLEGEAPLRLDADRMRQRYHNTLAAHRAAISKGCRAAGIGFHHTTTATDLLPFLQQVLLGSPATVGQRR